MNRSYVWKNYINDHRSNSHSIPTQVSQANMKFSREGKHFRLSSNNMNKSVSIHSKQRAESNPATSKVTTDAAEVFSNNEVAFFCTLPMITPLFVVQKRTHTFTTTCSCKGSHCVHDLSRYIEDPVSEFDHYCWISCDEEYEEMTTERAVTRTEEQRMEICRETTNDSKEGRSKKRMERWKNNAWKFAGKQRMTQRKEEVRNA